MRINLFYSLALVGSANATKVKGLLRKEDIPSSGKDWVTLDNGVEFQPSDDTDPRLDHVRKLWKSNENVEEVPMFVDGTETYYDEYAQAWRLLGFYIDCDHCGGEDNYNKAECLEQNEAQACQRFLLWAAYVDLDYAGNGVGEYMYYDRETSNWVDQACKVNNSPRCVKMDCHEPTTHFSLLGFFKEPDYSSWMEQLFKHQGDCVWTDDEYKMMQSGRDSWPTQCKQVDDSLYYDTKPAAGGNLDIGLYSDAQCIYEYDGDVTAADVITSFGGNENNYGTLEEELDAWNKAFDAFKICMPCKTSDLITIFASEAVNATGDRYDFRDEDGYDNDADTGFVCHDDAGYEGVNQCMKFRTKTPMLTASYKDLVLAESQGTVTGISVNGVQFGEAKSTRNNHLWVSIMLLVLAVALFSCALMKCLAAREESQQNLKAPLLERSASRSTSRSRSSRSLSRTRSSS